MRCTPKSPMLGRLASHVNVSEWCAPLLEAHGRDLLALEWRFLTVDDEAGDEVLARRVPPE